MDHETLTMSTPDIAVPAPRDGEVVSLRSWFGSCDAFELEIGCGKGGFLLDRARRHPDIRFLGVEWANKYYKFAADRMKRWGLTNVRVMRTDARLLFLHHLPPACIDVLHLYHPDPWPKKRHYKRRLVQADFAAAAVRALRPDGRWLLQSDHREYFQQCIDVLKANPELEEIRWDEAGIDTGEDWAGTNFEIKYAREGRAIYRAAYRRRYPSDCTVRSCLSPS